MYIYIFFETFVQDCDGIEKLQRVYSYYYQKSLDKYGYVCIIDSTRLLSMDQGVK
jgi:hypothetical protein